MIEERRRFGRTGAGQNVRVIVSHRLESGRRGGHFSVLTALDEDAVMLHDPFLGPRRLLLAGMP